MQKIADGQPWKMPATIDDPGALEEVTGSLKSAGFAAKA
jgi:propionyl-CoA synthetase